MCLGSLKNELLLSKLVVNFFFRKFWRDGNLFIDGWGFISVKKIKLVRDKYLEIYNKDDYIEANDEEFFNVLLEKLDEEILEFKSDKNPEELVDILETIYALAGFINVSKDELEKIRKEKADRLGAFNKRLIWIK